MVLAFSDSATTHSHKRNNYVEALAKQVLRHFYYYHYYNYYLSACLLSFFFCFFLSFFNPASRAQGFGSTLVLWFHIFYCHAESNEFFSLCKSAALLETDYLLN